MSVIEAFPTRPLQLTSYYSRPKLWSLVLICVCIAGLAYEVYSATPSLVDDYRLHAGGTVAEQRGIENGVCHMRIFNDCEFDARYVTSDGSSHTRHIELLTVFQEPDQKSDFTVRYDAASPEHISTSWGARLLPNRTITLIGEVVFLLLVIAYAGWLFVYPIHLRRKLTVIGAQPTPVEVKLEGVVPGSGSATISFSWTDATGRSLNASTEFQGTKEPFSTFPSPVPSEANISSGCV